MKNLSTNKQNFPPQIKYIIGNEACERFSYYGMRSILVIFMINHLMISQIDAKATYHLFAGAVYLFPLLGGYISDKLFGKYKTILYLSLVYCLGHLCLALWENRTGLYLGLGLIALGSGGIKPCVSAYVGDQFSEKNKSLLSKIFDIFYFSVNFGSFFSTLLIPIVLTRYGASWAFGIPGILMAIATFLFWLGRKQYMNIPPSRESGTAGFMPVLLYSLFNRKKKKPGQELFDAALAKYSLEEVDGAKAVWSIIKVFITVSVFWALFDQNASTWVLQAQQMDLNFFGMPVEAAQIQALNPIMVMLLIPLFGSVIYPAFERMGYALTPLKKMSVGMVLAGASFVVVGLLQGMLDSGNKISVAWQILPYFILTCSEVMVSITGLEFAYTQAPKTMKSTIMSFWLMTVFLGNFLDAFMAKLNVFQGSMFFYFFAGLMFLVSLVFMMSASRYKVRSYMGASNTLVTA
jgi:POT family proton-dependent oligopeptide transporter